MRLTRRRLLHGLLLVAGIDTIDAGRRAWAADALTGSEIDDLLAFAEVLVGSAALSSQERRYLADHVDDRVRRTPDRWLALYRTTVKLLGRLAGRPFSRLDVAERAALVARHRLSTATVLPDERLGPFAADARAVRTDVVPDLLGGYYASPAGWALVGYDAAFPGQCSDLARYTGPGG